MPEFHLDLFFFRRQDTPQCLEIEQKQQRRKRVLHTKLANRIAGLGSDTESSQSFGSMDHVLTPPSIVCTEFGSEEGSSSVI